MNVFIAKIIKRGIALFVTGALLLTAVGAQTMSGYDIMKKADEVERGSTSSYVATMTLVSKNGNTRVREVVSYRKDFADSKRSVVVFRTPKDVAGVGYLMWEYDEDANGNKKDRDSWLFMPAMKKVRRISGSESGDDFMGTDFTYDDMGDRGLAKDTFTLLGEEAVNGVLCYKVECVAKDATEKNPRRILWVRKDNFIVQRGEYYSKQNTLQRVLECEDIQQIDGIWTTGKMTMKNVKTEHATVIEMKDIHYNQQIADSLFTVASLERGAIK
ncbi:MAG: outer membrane lipoprotein-sorting protein [Treponema sp.]|nr:outer membrane lipoprotein-sorting protein [Treponema sp.]